MQNARTVSLKVNLVFPQLTFEKGEFSLRVGKKNLILTHTPGHSRDGLSVFIEEDRVLFAGDAFLPIPYIVDGNIDELALTIKKIGKMGLENIVQGHGDIILRGEIENSVKKTWRISLVFVKQSVQQRDAEIQWMPWL